MIKINKKIFITFFVVMLVIGGVVIAGEITNNSAPDATTMPYTLADIYNKLTNSDYGNNPSHNLYPAGSVTEGSMPSLGEIYDVIPAYKTLDGSTTTVETGIYGTTILADIPSSGLTAENIASGTTIFGITGTYECTPPTP